MKRKKKQPKDKVFGHDIPGTSGTQTSGYPAQKLSCKWPSVVLFRERPGCPGIWVGTSWVWKNFMQENFGLSFCSLGDPPKRLMVHFGYGQEKNNKLNFLWPKMACWGSRFRPQNHHEKVYAGPFLRSFSGNEAHKPFSGVPKWAVLGGGQI